METPESIRLSLQKGEWVTSLDFSGAYFPTHYQALPFGLSIASGKTQLLSRAFHVPDRSADCNQLLSGHLHKRPVQWHLKNNFHIPESMKKHSLIPKFLHSHSSVQGAKAMAVYTLSRSWEGLDL